jgi:hypothetical protein
MKTARHHRRTTGACRSAQAKTASLRAACARRTPKGMPPAICNCGPASRSRSGESRAGRPETSPVHCARAVAAGTVSVAPPIRTGESSGPSVCASSHRRARVGPSPAAVSARGAMTAAEASAASHVEPTATPVKPPASSMSPSALGERWRGRTRERHHAENGKGKLHEGGMTHFRLLHQR